MKNLLFIWLQYLLPQHLLSRLTGWFADSDIPWIKNNLIKIFIRHFNVDMSEAEQAMPVLYKNFNAFFTRKLKPDARPLEGGENTIVSPADGAISQIGDINNDNIIQAKGQDYSATTLLGGDPDLASLFTDGKFVTIYLSPKDYHRVHMPYGGKLKKMIYIPGDLFSVNNVTAENVSNLFARNERLVCLFETDRGPMAMVLVGAMIVAAIETVWAGQITPLPRDIISTDYSQPRDNIHLGKGEEMGRFKLGSTVILLFGKELMDWVDSLPAQSSVKMGQALGEFRV